MKKLTTSYYDDLMRDLKDPRAAIGYLNAALDDPDKRVFLLALRDVSESWGGMTKLSKAAKVSRITLYKILSNKGNPEVETLKRLLHTLGLCLRIDTIRPRHLRRAA